MLWLILILFVIVAIIYSILPYAAQVVLDIIFLIGLITLIVKFVIVLHKNAELKDRLKIFAYIFFVILVAIGSVLALRFIYILALSKL